MAILSLRGVVTAFLGILSTASCSGQANVNANFPLRVRKILELPTPYAPASVAWSADGSKLTAGDWDSFTVWDRNGRQLTAAKNVSSADAGPLSIAFYSGTSQLIRPPPSGVDDRALVGIWDARSGKLVKLIGGPTPNIPGGGPPIAKFVLLEENRLLAGYTASDARDPNSPGNLLVYSLRDWSVFRSYKINIAMAGIAAFAGDTKLIVGGPGNGDVTVVNLKNSGPPFHFTAYEGSKYGQMGVSAVSGSPDGNLVLASADGGLISPSLAGTPGEREWERSVPAVKLFRSTDGREMDTFKYAPPLISDAAWDRKNRFVAFTDESGGFYLWQGMTKPAKFEKFNLPAGGEGLSISRAGDRVAVATGRGVAIFSIESKAR